MIQLAGAYSKNILIVDDNFNLREILKNFLESSGFQIATARDAEEALRLLRKNFFALMLTNYTMPGITGAELISLVKANYPYLKIWGMSSLDRKEEFYRAGADFVLEKPFQLSRLSALLETI